MKTCAQCSQAKQNNQLICIQQGNDINTRINWCITCKPEYAQEIANIWSNSKLVLNDVVVKKI